MERDDRKRFGLRIPDACPGWLHREHWQSQAANGHIAISASLTEGNQEDYVLRCIQVAP